jgi:predicted DCC family thiol-disulfide oxidoreductase YuxK
MAQGWKPRAGEDVPDGLILFDGVCVLCSRWVRFVLARDRAERFRFVPIQSPYGRSLAAAWQIDPENPETNAVVLRGRVYFKSDATLRALAVLPRWWWVRALIVVPPRLRDWLYDLIAGNRYTLFGKTETCRAPGADLARRLVLQRPSRGDDE